MSATGVPPTLIIVPPLVLEPAYGVHLDLSVDPPMVPTLAYGTLETLSVGPPSVLLFKYGILVSKVQPLSLLPYHMESQLAKFTMPPIVMSTVMYSTDRKAHLGLV